MLNLPLHIVASVSSRNFASEAPILLQSKSRTNAKEFMLLIQQHMELLHLSKSTGQMLPFPQEHGE
jgi:hypothetical protein